MSTTSVQFRLKRRTTEQWATAPNLANGEPGFETTTGRLKIGNGTSTWAQLPYVSNLRTDTAANLSALVLGTGEVGFASDTNSIKVGDGVTTYSSLTHTTRREFDRWLSTYQHRQGAINLTYRGALPDNIQTMSSTTTVYTLSSVANFATSTLVNISGIQIGNRTTVNTPSTTDLITATTTPSSGYNGTSLAITSVDTVNNRIAVTVTSVGPPASLVGATVTRTTAVTTTISSGPTLSGTTGVIYTVADTTNFIVGRTVTVSGFSVSGSGFNGTGVITAVSVASGTGTVTVSIPSSGTTTSTGNMVLASIPILATSSPYMNTRYRYKLAKDCTEIQLVYSNLRSATFTGYAHEGFNYNPVTISASIENPYTAASPNVSGGDNAANTVLIPVTFNGSYSGVMGPQSVLISDPIPVHQVLAGNSLWIRTSTVTANPSDLVVTEISPQSGINLELDFGEGYSEGTQTDNAVDFSRGGTMTTTFGNGVGPCAILGRTVRPTVSMLGLLDSIISGTHTQIPNHQWLSNACYKATIPYINAGIPGTSFSALNTGVFSNNVVTNGRRNLMRYVNHIADNGSVNDLASIGTLAAFKTVKLAEWKRWYQMGKRIVAFTIQPQTNSTNAWLTAAGQSVRSATEPIRVGYNDWLRDTTTNGARSQFISDSSATTYDIAIIDICQYVEVNSSNVLTTNGGRWIAYPTVSSGTLGASTQLGALSPVLVDNGSLTPLPGASKINGPSVVGTGQATRTIWVRNNANGANSGKYQSSQISANSTGATGSNITLSSAAVSSNAITIPANTTIAVGNAIKFDTSALNIVSGTIYYVQTVSPTTGVPVTSITLSETAGGSVFTLTDGSYSGIASFLTSWNVSNSFFASTIIKNGSYSPTGATVTYDTLGDVNVSALGFAGRLNTGVYITGLSGGSGFNGAAMITDFPTNTKITVTYPTAPTGSATAAGSTETLTLGTVAVTAAASAAGTTQYTVQSTSQFSVGDGVIVSGITVAGGGSGFNGTGLITAVTGALGGTITVAIASTGTASGFINAMLTLGFNPASGAEYIVANSSTLDGTHMTEFTQTLLGTNVAPALSALLSNTVM